MKNISKKDLKILRDLAKKQCEIAKSDKMQTLKNEWLLHNTFRGSRPMVHIEMGFSHEIIPPRLKCEGDFARDIEWRLYSNFLNHTLFDDDFVVKDYYPVTLYAGIKPFDLDVEVITTDGVGHQFKQIITDLKEDFHKLGKSSYSSNKDRAHKEVLYINELFGDILPAKLEGRPIYAVPTQHIVHLMGMESMLFAMYDYPNEFKKMMDMLAEDYINLCDYLETNQLILPTAGAETLMQGSFCFTDELPSEDVKTTRDIWGYIDSQETVGVSPEMFGEFIKPCYEKIISRFGLLSYGCCEPVHSIFATFLSKLDNLRKLSVSPWCDEEAVGAALRGRNIIFHRKPSPNLLGVGTALDETAVTEHIDRTAKAAKGCALEITQRDVYTVASNPEKVRRYVEIIRQRLS